MPDSTDTAAHRTRPGDRPGAPKRLRRHETGLLVALVPVALATYGCAAWLDPVVAHLVRRRLYTGGVWSRYTASLPDALFILVLCVTLGSYGLYRYRASRTGTDAPTIMYKVLAIAAPASYVAKSLLKYCFGRITTREWLLAPQGYGFHWFSGIERYSGFPSGHMAVFTALAAVVGRFHPRSRPACLAVLLVLALSLITTNYHFLGDVIAGAYLGLVVEAVTCRVVGRAYPFLPLDGA